MEQQIKIVDLGGTPAGAEEELKTAWEAATSPDGVRPAIEAAYPLGNGFTLLVFRGDLARATIRTNLMRVQDCPLPGHDHADPSSCGCYAAGLGDGRQEVRQKQEVPS